MKKLIFVFGTICMLSCNNTPKVADVINNDSINVVDTFSVDTVEVSDTISFDSIN